MSLITLTNIEKHYGSVQVLNNINLSIESGELVALRGASGSGKSTLLYLLGGLDSPSNGNICVNHKDLTLLNDEELAQYRNTHVGFVFQFHFLLPSMNCLDNILLSARIGGHKVKNVEKHVLDLAQYLDVSHCLSKFPFEISGGEQQRINIIRALSLRPKLLLCDEPTGNLDSLNSKKVTSLLMTLAQEFHSTLLVVTHDDNVGSQFPRKIVIEDGRIIS